MKIAEPTERQPSYEELLAENAALKQQLAELQALVALLSARVRELEDQLAKNSSNSSKPPSSDSFGKRTTSLRPKSDKPPGGQKGHKGKTLEMVAEPDEVIVHRLEECWGCGTCLATAAVLDYDKRQVFDLPPLQVVVSEHQAEIKRCSECGRVNQAGFPEGVSAKTQYGPRLKGLAQYLQHYQLLPLKRTQETFADLFGHQLSQATLVGASESCYLGLAGVEAGIKQSIIASEVIHVDETGLYEQGRRHWLHVASTQELTFYAAHAKRGQEALDDLDILPLYQGTAVHDAYASYSSYPCRHSLCNAHLLRELRFLFERHGQGWAKDLAELLGEIKAAVEQQAGAALAAARRAEFKERYDTIVSAGLAAQPPPAQAPAGKRGRPKQSPAKNLLDRLATRRDEVLAFMDDPKVPFDNNLAERDIRMMKVQQKISGSFRGEGARYFCRIRGYISTLRKQGMNVLEALESVFRGQPLIPKLES